jgi:hypothetical protein
VPAPDAGTAVAATPLTAASQQATQALLLTLLTTEFEQLWPTLDIGALKKSLPTFTLATTALVQRYGLASGALAADYYDAERRAARAAGRFTVTPAPTADLDQVNAAVGWATKGLWSTDPDVEPALTLTTGTVEKMVGDVGRYTLLNAVQDDKAAHGWARVPEPGCCYFCAMLASRGAVYRSRQKSSFEAHDHCKCHVEPLFAPHYEPTAQIRGWQALYRDSTAGKSGAAARLAFRQAYEGRTPTTSGRSGR